MTLSEFGQIIGLGATASGGLFFLVRSVVSLIYKKNIQLESAKQENRKTVVGNIEANQEKLSTEFKEFRVETKSELKEINGTLGKTREEIAEHRIQLKTILENQDEIKTDFKDFHQKTKQLLSICLGRIDELEKSRIVRLGPNSVMIKGEKK